MGVRYIFLVESGWSGTTKDGNCSWKTNVLRSSVAFHCCRNKTQADPVINM